MGFTEVEEIRKKDVRVVFQGVEGAYSHAAVRMYFGEDADAYHVEKFEDTIRELERGQADYAVLPIENSTAGFVITNYDLLSRYDNYIVGEIYVPVDHVLLGVPGASVSDVKTVYSHNQALMQCLSLMKLSQPTTQRKPKRGIRYRTNLSISGTVNRKS